MKTVVHQQPWFATWFDSHYYHQLYQHRNDKEAENFIDILINELQPATKSWVLDVGCGAGRHSKYLASKGFRVLGLDLSASSIREANKFSTPSLRFLKWDMRKPFGKNNFDVVFSFFTSFGYFNSMEENNKVINNMVTALTADGTLLIDYLNVAYAERNLVAVEEKEIDGLWYHINRWTDERFIYKRIAIQHQQQSVSVAYTEQVAKFRIADFDEFFSRNALKLTAVYGDYELNDYNEHSSKRMILVARRH